MQKTNSIHKFRVSGTKSPHLVLTTQNQKSLKQLLAFLNLYCHAKNSGICAGTQQIVFIQKILFKNSGRPAQSDTSYEFLVPDQNSEKTDDPIPRKHPERRFQLIPGGSNKRLDIARSGILITHFNFYNVVNKITIFDFFNFLDNF